MKQRKTKAVMSWLVGLCNAHSLQLSSSCSVSEPLPWPTVSSSSGASDVSLGLKAAFSLMRHILISLLSAFIGHRR